MSLNNYTVALNCLLFILMAFSEINGIFAVKFWLGVKLFIPMLV